MVDGRGGVFGCRALAGGYIAGTFKSQSARVSVANWIIDANTWLVWKQGHSSSGFVYVMLGQ